MKRQRIALFHNHPECSVECAHGILRALSLAYDVDVINRDELTDAILSKYKMIAFPGGIGDSNRYYKLLADKQDVIQNQIVKGKRYLGICMGAYWAGPHYFNILEDVNPVQYIKRPNAETNRSYGTVVNVTWNGHDEEMFFYDGCSLLGDTNKFETIATYSNGDPAAIIQKNIGVIGPHPESDIYWYKKKFLKPYWHEYRHHTLLLKFVKRLMR